MTDQIESFIQQEEELAEQQHRKRMVSLAKLHAARMSLTLINQSMKEPRSYTLLLSLPIYRGIIGRVKAKAGTFRASEKGEQTRVGIEFFGVYEESRDACHSGSTAKYWDPQYHQTE